MKYSGIDINNMFEAQRKVLENASLASRLSEMNNVNQLLGNYNSIDFGLSVQIQRATQRLALSAIPNIVVPRIELPNNQLYINKALGALSESGMLINHNMSNMIYEISKQIEGFSNNICVNGILSSYAEQISNIIEDFTIPTISDILDDFNFESELEFEELDIEEEEKEELVNEAKTSVKETFLEINDKKILNFTQEENFNIEQKIMNYYERMKIEHPLLADAVLRVYGKIFDIIWDCIKLGIMTLMMSTIIMSGSKTTHIFSKIKEEKKQISIYDAKKEVRSMVNKEHPVVKNGFYNTYRYINKDNSYIRDEHRMSGYSSKKVDKGDIVEVQFTEDGRKMRYKNWIYVKYEDSEGNIYEGWINNVYTNRIDKK